MKDEGDINIMTKRYGTFKNEIGLILIMLI